MKNPELERLQALLTEIEDQIDDIESDELEERVLDLEEEINAAIEQCFEEEVEAYKKLQKRVKAIKKEHDFYDEEAELDMMFPDRHDEDFDPDSIS
jgi:septation ring formation regulator EzrA